MVKKLTFNDTSFPNMTSPETVRWSNSNRSGMFANLIKNSLTCDAGDKKTGCKMSVEMYRASQFHYSLGRLHKGFLTFLKEVPSLTRGTDGKHLLGFISSAPVFKLYKLLITTSRSDDVFTGKNLLLGTLTPAGMERDVHNKSGEVCLRSPSLIQLVLEWFSLKASGITPQQLTYCPLKTLDSCSNRCLKL